MLRPQFGQVHTPAMGSIWVCLTSPLTGCRFVMVRLLRVVSLMLRARGRWPMAAGGERAMVLACAGFRRFDRNEPLGAATSAYHLVVTERWGGRVHRAAQGWFVAFSTGAGKPRLRRAGRARLAAVRTDRPLRREDATR